jgi:hypothetical protein
MRANLCASGTFARHARINAYLFIHTDTKCAYDSHGVLLMIEWLFRRGDNLSERSQVGLNPVCLEVCAQLGFIFVG